MRTLHFWLSFMLGPRKRSFGGSHSTSLFVLLSNVAILSLPFLLFTTACLFDWLAEDRGLNLA